MIEMNHWKLDNIFECLRQAGAVALKFRCAAEVALKPDHTVVTIADREIEAMLAAKFNRPEAGCYMIGEESIAECSEAYLQEAFRNLCYVVDPIDGTAPYSTDVPLWGISIGLMENGTWAPMAAKLMRTELEGMKNITVCENVVTIRSAVSAASEAQMDQLAEELIAK